MKKKYENQNISKFNNQALNLEKNLQINKLNLQIENLKYENQELKQKLNDNEGVNERSDVYLDDIEQIEKEIFDESKPTAPTN